MFKSALKSSLYVVKTNQVLQTNIIVGSRQTSCLLLNTRSLYAKSKCYFSNIKQNAEESASSLNNTPNEKHSETAQDTENIEEIKEDFVEYMKREPKNEDMIYDFNKRVLFRFDPDMEEWKGKKRMHWSLAGVFSGATYLTYLYLNPWAALVPGALTLASLLTLRASSTFDRKTIHKIELVDNYHIKLYPLGLKGGDILCDIQETELMGCKSCRPLLSNKKMKLEVI